MSEPIESAPTGQIIWVAAEPGGPFIRARRQVGIWFSESAWKRDAFPDPLSFTPVIWSPLTDCGAVEDRPGDDRAWLVLTFWLCFVGLVIWAV